MKNIVKFLILFGFPGTYFFARFFKLQIFSDYLGLAEVGLRDYFGLILGSTATILGVLIAILLLAIQFSKTSSLRRKQETVLEDWKVFTFSALSIAVIVLSVFAYITVNSVTQPGAINIGYLITYLFLAFVVFLFPAVNTILSTSDHFFGESQGSTFLHGFLL
ncbi:large-conductance mechanosensitive channel [Pedobacter sp. W3I1]|uniref:hypothetical protein n=1 Tax=Pedobacter sp. W3I1 TaxID=3042291 RepID=UPI002788CC7F|nr:hypothetical protein [Pedobacter sp. W3I1]MDQ0640203.1 large-conductance mechanosensitive channel [Pedobacter sp. W3I1]